MESLAGVEPASLELNTKELAHIVDISVRHLTLERIAALVRIYSNFIFGVL